MAEDKIVYTPCQGWGCHEFCILEVHVRDGEIHHCQKATLPGRIGVDVQICKKGVVSGKLPYSKERLLYPMKRVGERGSGEFERISWDQALDEISEKMQASIDKYGPKSIAFYINHCGTPGMRMNTDNRLSNRLVNALGAAKLEYTSADYASVHQDVADTGMPWTANRNIVMATNDFLIIWGGNPVGFTRPARLTHMILDCRERGAKVVHISNMFDNTSAKVDQWIPVVTGTDAALALGMAYTIVHEGLTDKDFLLDETVAAYLVRTDTGKLLREADVVENGRDDWFAVVDGKTGEVAFIPKQPQRHFGYGDVEPVMEAEGTINGIEYKSCWNLLLEHLEDYTPEKQEAITGVPAEVCKQLAIEYATAESSTIAFGNGLRYQNSTQCQRAMKLLTYLTGKYGKYGSGIITTGIDNLSYNTLDHNCVYGDPEFTAEPAELLSFTKMIESFDDPTMQQYRVMMFCEGNALLNHPNKDFWDNRVLSHMDLVVSCEIRMTDSCRHSDYILPVCPTLERTEFIADVDNSYILCEAARSPQGESKTPTFIYSSIAERLGLGQYFTRTHEEWVQFGLEHNTEELFCYPDVTEKNATGKETPVKLTWDMLKERKTIHMAKTDDEYLDVYAFMPYFNTTGRIEFYSEDYSEIGQAICNHENCIVIDPEVHKKNPFHFFIGRHKYFMQGQFSNSPEMLELAKRSFGVTMNTAAAVKLGLRDGDDVEVFNENGVMKAKLQLREDVPPNMVQTWYTFDETYYYPYGNLTPQDLATASNAPEIRTPWAVVSGKKWRGVQSACGVPESEMFIAGDDTPEVIFDAVCNIRKAEK